ncbi:hypothetical protein TanjilG_12395 [Lupinus angustifolius]|uniref:Uncharacterized protein n=1 Tax=Lupinus angustifolius TaxID=3871 RepID=A0A4P1QY78_LUPAN|nr:PREDICTED: uncharacterized protein LOC109326424 [Lupinus angustifolius]OIV97638.1 hypothetical protein TanjilG_12395 [Lupinus angustifolius]
MEVLGTPPNDYFDFYYSRISPCFSAPSSPKRFGEMFMSAPTTPSRISDFYSKFEYFSISSPTPKADDNDGFGFFDGGRIKPLNEDNDLLESDKSPLLCPKHPKRSTIVQGKKLDREVYSPRERNESYNIDNNGESESRRGRDRTPSFASSNSGLRRATRSHSPYIEPHHTWIEESQKEMINKEDVTKGSLSSMLTPKSSRKWRLRDLLLFRSASEGSGSSKDSLGKYPILFRKGEEGKGYSSFRSSNKPPRSKKKETISAHELHYARKKAETEDLKKRTFLPYKKGILGILAASTR